MKLAQLTARIVGDFRDPLRDAGVSIVTTRKILSTLSAMLAWAISQDMVAVNAVQDLKQADVAQKCLAVLDDAAQDFSCARLGQILERGAKGKDRLGPGFQIGQPQPQPACHFGHGKSAEVQIRAPERYREGEGVVRAKRQGPKLGPNCIGQGNRAARCQGQGDPAILGGGTAQVRSAAASALRATSRRASAATAGSGAGAVAGGCHGRKNRPNRSGAM